MSVQFVAGRFHADDASGAPLVGGLLYTYASGTTTPKATYTTSALSVANTNPVVLDSRGEAQVWLGTGAYTFVLKTSAGATVWSVDGVEDPGDAVSALQSDLASTSDAAKGAGMVGYSSSLSYATGTVGWALGTVQNNAKVHLGAVGDGIADDTLALQAALDSAVPVYLPEGTYRITSGLVYSHGSRLLGAGNWSGVASTYSTTNVSRILYDGPTGTNKYIVRISDTDIGIEPTTAASRDMQNCTLCDVVLDGNGKAEYGLYMVRAWAMNRLERITVTNTLKHAFWAGACWFGSPRDWNAYKNQGCGITLGNKATFGWTNATVDQSACINFAAYYCGANSSGTTLNVFDEVTNYDKGYGIGVFGSRALRFYNAQAQNCDGAGVYLSTYLMAPYFDGGYIEGNGRSSSSTAQWAIWIQGDASLVTADITFDHTHLGLTPAIRMAGTAPSRQERGILFYRMPFLGTVKADWNNYRLVDCDRSVTISATAPAWFDQQLNGARSMGTSGVVVFDATTGVIVTKRLQGVISGVTRTAAGTYTVALSEVYSGGNYGIRVSGGDNCSVGTTTILNNSFVVTNRVGGVLSDTNARITAEVIGDYN